MKAKQEKYQIVHLRQIIRLKLKPKVKIYLCKIQYQNMFIKKLCYLLDYDYVSLYPN